MRLSGDALARQLSEAAAEAARISRLISDSWWDERGGELAAGVARVGHEIDVQAQRAARVAEEVAAMLTAAPSAPRLPSAGVRRENEERGVRLPLFDDGASDRSPS
jgi:hypothetical protein